MNSSESNHIMSNLKFSKIVLSDFRPTDPAVFGIRIFKQDTADPDPQQ